MTLNFHFFDLKSELQLKIYKQNLYKSLSFYDCPVLIYKSIDDRQMHFEHGPNNLEIIF